MEELANRLVQPIDRMLERLNATAVFGEPTREGDLTVIPVADVVLGFGYGYGGGPAPAQHGPAPEHQEDAAVEAPAEGGGGGGGGRASPRGYLKVSPDGVRFEPIIDQGKIALAGLALSAWSVFWIARTIRAFADEDE